MAEHAKTCCECGKQAARLRRDRCDACYMRIYRGGEVPAGATCVGCDERRRDVLVLQELGAGEVVVCGNCALIVRRARPRIETVEALRRRTARERRVATITWRGEERRVAAPRRAERPSSPPPPPDLDMSID